MSDDFDDSFWMPRSKRDAAVEFDELRQNLRSSASVLELPSPGDVVNGRYEVIREIGRGGFGCVLEVEHRLLGHRFAMKIMTPEIANRPGWAERFREEARATSQLGSQHIVFVTDFGECPEYGSFIVMEYLEGVSLREVLRDEGPQSVQQTLELVRAASNALAAVHELGIVHCDLKPGNIFRAEGAGRVVWKLLDFGTSSIVMSAAKTQTLYGTPKYMAPEQALGEEVDGRADIFALGIVAYRMLSGRLPWECRMWLQATPKYRRNNPPEPLTKLCDGLPPALGDVVLRALEVDPDDRFDRIEDFAREFASAVDSTDIPAPEADPEDAHRSDYSETIRSSVTPEVRIERGDSPTIPGIAAAANLPVVRVEFRDEERLRREYRRNLLVGGLFVPTHETFDIDTRVEIELRVSGRDSKCRVRGRVVHATGTRSKLAGFGVKLDAGASDIVARWVEKSDDELDPTTVLRSAEGAPVRASLSPGEMFVMSRLESGMTYGQLAGMCSGAGFDLAATVESMLHRGYLEIGAPARSDHRVTVGPSGQGKIRLPTRGRRPAALDIDEVDERIDFLRSRGNYLGALEFLRSTIERWPGAAALRYRHARLMHEFGQERAGVLRAARGAVELAPTNPEYRTFLETLE